ncbi:MAG: hypothetical protein F9K29_01225 [Hyphomicrobiaceae bacterium]|nr:MAG: hypothetical protein F9K29_01225 [Hyphomicrobiaceae bacterium]
MRLKHWLAPAVAALALGYLAAPGQAAPLTGVAADAVRALDSENSAVDNVHFRRRCWRHRGHWHCRRHVRRWYPRHYYYDDYYYGGYYPRRYYYKHKYRPGFAIYAPGFGLYIAPRYKRRYWY